MFPPDGRNNYQINDYSEFRGSIRSTFLHDSWCDQNSLRGSLYRVELFFRQILVT